MHGQSKQSRLRRSSTKHIWELLKTTLIQSPRGAIYSPVSPDTHMFTAYIHGSCRYSCRCTLVCPAPMSKGLHISNAWGSESETTQSDFIPWPWLKGFQLPLDGFYRSVWGSGFRLRGFGLWGGEDTFRSNPSVNALSRTEPSLS